MRRYLAILFAKDKLVSILPIASIGFLLRLYQLSFKPLWYDELIAVTLSMLPFMDILINLRKIEVHPPPYYLQLSLWMLLGTSDFGIKLNSVMWNILAIFSLFYTTRSICGKQVSILASILFALSPLAVFYAQEVRPYSLLMFLGIWSWYFTHRLLYGCRSPMIRLGFMASTLLFLYGHGAGFLLLPSITTYAMFYLVENFRKWRNVLHLTILQALTIIFYIPWLFRARSVKMRHTLAPGWEDISVTLYGLMFGNGYLTWLPQWVSLISLILLIIALSVLVRHSIFRNIAFSFVAIPIISCIAISHLISPIWLARTLSFVLPFWCLVLALTFSLAFFQRTKSGRRYGFIGYGIYAIFAIVLLASTIYQQKTFDWVWNIRDASRFVSTAIDENDIIYIPDKRLFWAWNWYYSGPGSVNPLTTDYFRAADGGVSILSSPTIEKFVESGRTYWLIYRPMDDLASFLSLTGILTRELIMDFHGLTVEKVHVAGRNIH
jgi:uncharacterized membrane protein